MAHTLFEKLHIYGWQDIEPAVCAAFVTRHPILLVGIQGENKTEGLQILAKAMLGEGRDVQVYDMALISPDDLLGYLNAKALAEGKKEYIKSPGTVWHCWAFVADEINRAPETTAGKMMELIRKGTVNGEQTQVKYRFAACNPPKLFGSFFMDRAMASRFLILQTPDDKAQATLRKVLKLRRSSTQPVATEEAAETFSKGIFAARKHKLSRAELDACEAAVLQIARETASLQGGELRDLLVGKRQWADLFTTFKSLLQLRHTLFAKSPITEEQFVLAALGHFPEVQGVTRQTVQVTALRRILSSAVKVLMSADERGTLDLLAEAPAEEEQPHWASVICDRLNMEDDVSTVRRVGRRTAYWLRKGRLQEPVAEVVLKTCVERMLSIEPTCIEDERVGHDRGELAQAIMASLLERPTTTKGA